jgi:ABC-type transporter Mla subunit MlaD
VAAGIAVGIILLAVVGIGLGGKSNSRHQVAIVFDAAKGMVPGQVLKIAGTQAGTVDAIELTAKRQARFVVSVDARFLPFRSDAQCQIRPEALISENYVSCNPGSPSKPPLTSRTGGLQTVPVDHTTTPVSLQDLINLFTVPIGDRVRVLIDELGIGTAGRGDDLNALLRRAKPSLVQAHRLLQVIYTQREAIGTIMREGRRALADSARQPAQLEALIGRASDVFETIGSHHQQVEDDLKSLPPLLAAASPALHSVDRVADNATPLLRARPDRSVPPYAGHCRASRRSPRSAGPPSGPRAPRCGCSFAWPPTYDPFSPLRLACTPPSATRASLTRRCACPSASARRRRRSTLRATS